MGWFFIAILLPLVAPLLALLVFKLFPQVSPVPLIAPFKDGQLCWVVLSFSASGLYEISPSLGKAIVVSSASTGWLAGLLTMPLVFSAMIAAKGAVFLRKLTTPAWLACFPGGTSLSQNAIFQGSAAGSKRKKRNICSLGRYFFHRSGSAQSLQSCS